MKKQLTPSTRRLLIAFGACWVIGGLGALASWDNARNEAATTQARPQAVIGAAVTTDEAKAKTNLEREAADAYERITDPAANCSAVLNRCW
jgi:hypothetical protein